MEQELHAFNQNSIIRNKKEEFRSIKLTVSWFEWCFIYCFGNERDYGVIDVLALPRQAKKVLTDKSIICALLLLRMGAGDLNLLDC